MTPPSTLNSPEVYPAILVTSSWASPFSSPWVCAPPSVFLVTVKWSMGVESGVSLSPLRLYTFTVMVFPSTSNRA